MYVKNQNFAIYLILAVVVGFGLSFLFGGLSVQSGLASGDISKAERYSNQKEDPSFTVIEEKLKNDEDFLNSTRSAFNAFAGMGELVRGSSQLEQLGSSQSDVNLQSRVEEIYAR